MAHQNLSIPLTGLYVKLGDEIVEERWLGRPPRLTDCELVTLAVAQALLWGWLADRTGALPAPCLILTSQEACRLALARTSSVAAFTTLAATSCISFGGDCWARRCSPPWPRPAHTRRR